MWYYHAMNTTRNNTLVVPVVYTGVDASVMMEKELPSSITVVVRENGKRIRMLRKTNPQITLDLTRQMGNESGELTISTERLKERVDVILPGTSQLIELRPELIHTTYVRQRQKKVDISMAADLKTQPEYQIQSISMNPNSILVFGSREQLKAIQTIETEPEVYKHLKDTDILTMALVAPEGIRLEKDSVEVTVISERFTEKKMTLPIEVRHIPEGKSIRLFPQKVEVKMSVGTKYFQDINEDHIRVYTDYPTTHRNQLEVKVEVESKHVSNIHYSPKTVEYIIEK